MVVSDESKFLSYMRFGNYLIHPHGLPFGLPASPSKFQLSNRLGTKLVSQYHERCYLYLDDRCVASTPLPNCFPEEYNATRGIDLINMSSLIYFSADFRLIIKSYIYLNPYQNLYADTHLCLTRRIY